MPGKKSVATAADYQTAVQELYVSYFGRPADPAGLTNFENALLAANAPADVQGISQAYATSPAIQSLVNAFGTSSESQNLYGASSTSAFVSAIFQNVLNRAPLPSGLSYWVNAIDTGTLSKGNAALSIMAGALVNNSSQGVQDAQLINNRLTVASYFTSQVTSQNVVSSYAGSNAASSARTLLATVTAATNPTSFESTVTTTVSGLANTAKGMVFAPAAITLNYQAGTSSTATLTAQALNSNEFSGATNVYAVVTDPNAVFTADLQPVLSATNTYTVTLHTSSTLKTGQYKGSFQLQLCRDAACGSPFSGAPWSIQYTVQVASAPLIVTNVQATTVTMYTGGTTPSPVNVSVQDPTLSWTVSSNAPWIQPSVTSGTGNGGFLINFLTSALTTGTYTGNITVNSSDGQIALVPVSLTVLPTAFEINSGIASFTAVNGAPVTAQPVNFSLSSGGADNWTATGSNSWLTVSPASGVTPGTVNIGINPSNGPLASGTYSGNVVVSSQGIPNLNIPVSLNLVMPTLTAPSSSITIGGANGRSFGAQSLAFSLNTGTNTWPWTLSNLPSWLSAANTTGSVGGSGTTVSLSPNMQSLTPGSSTAVINVAARVNGDSPTLPVNVTLNIDQHKLLPSETGVAFTSVPGWSRLTHNITLSDNFGNSTAWTAQSNQSWLTVTSSGTTTGGNSTISLTANPAGMASNTVSYATVTFSSSDPTVQTVSVNVGFWNGTTTPSGVTTMAKTYTKLVPDTIRPFVYANNGGSSIDVYNIYTQQLVGTISNVGAAIGDMIVSGNGSRLYTLDTSSKTMAVVDLNAQSLLETWPVVNAVGMFTHLLSIHPNGVEVVLVGDGTAYSSEGAVLSQNLGTGVMAATSNGNYLYMQDEGLSPASIAGETVDYSQMSGGVLMHNVFASGWSVNNASNGADIAVSPDGSHLYTASGAPYGCGQVNPTNLTSIGLLPGAGAYPNNVKVDANGRVYCGIMGFYSQYDVWVYSSSGVLQSAYKFAGYAQYLLKRQLAVSADGMMMAGLTTDPLIAFIAVGP